MKAELKHSTLKSKKMILADTIKMALTKISSSRTNIFNVSLFQNDQYIHLGKALYYEEKLSSFCD
jgi:hypothetical protein